MKITTVLLGAVAVTTGFAWIKQREITAELRSEVAMGRDASRELAGLREEHARLTASAIPARELQAMRDDHAALTQLRSELSALQRKFPSEHPTAATMRKPLSVDP